MDAYLDDPSVGGLRRSPVSSAKSRYERKLQAFLDASVPHIAARWAFFVFVIVLYTVRVLLLQGFYIVTYGIGIFNLNLIIGFLTPAYDPELEDGPTLPTTSETEFKPFVRRVPEFKFWCAAGFADTVSLACAHPQCLCQAQLAQVVSHRLRDDLLLRIRRARVLAHPAGVLGASLMPCPRACHSPGHMRAAHAVCVDDEAPDQAHDQAPLRAVHSGQAQARRWRGGCRGREGSRKRQQVKIAG
jgi:hypothetical protein